MAERKRKRPARDPDPPALRVAGDDQGDDDQGKPLHDVPASELPPARVEWLWPNRLEWKTVAVLQGEKGAGKSTWLRALAADVTGGPRLPGSAGRKRIAGGVLWYSGEEDLRSRVRPALAAAGADLERVYCADCYGDDTEAQLQLPNDCPRLAARIRERAVALVVVDPIFAFSDGTCDLEGPTLPARRFMKELGKVAAATSSLIVISRNLTKDTTKGALAAGRGSAEIGNAARAVLHLQGIADQPGTFALAVAVCNNGRPVPTLTYTLDDREGMPVVKVRGESDLTADQLAGGEEGDLHRYQVDKAKALIRALLPGGQLASHVIRQKAEDAMIAVRTLQQAAKALGVRYHREGTREQTVVYWKPPKGGWA